MTRFWFETKQRYQRSTNTPLSVNAWLYTAYGRCIFSILVTTKLSMVFLLLNTALSKSDVRLLIIADVTFLLYSPTLLLPWNKQQCSLVTSLIYLLMHRLKSA
jgi:hypothetical protein